VELLHGFKELLFARMVTVDQAWLLWLTSHHRRRGDSLHRLVHGWWISSISLALVLSSDGPASWGRGSAGIAFGWTGIVVHSPHVVTEVPMTGEAVSRGGTLAALICTQVWFVAVPMHSVSFTLVAKEAGRGRETGILAGNDLAPVGFQVRIHKFTSRDYRSAWRTGMIGVEEIRTHSCT
jgi:hypothetical protein